MMLDEVKDLRLRRDIGMGQVRHGLQHDFALTQVGQGTFADDKGVRQNHPASSSAASALSPSRRWSTQTLRAGRRAVLSCRPCAEQRSGGLVIPRLRTRARERIAGVGEGGAQKPPRISRAPPSSRLEGATL
jgi:hypothetical protein